MEFPVNETACVRCGLGVGEKHSAAWLCVDREGIIPGSPGGSLPKIGEKKTFSRVPPWCWKGCGESPKFARAQGHTQYIRRSSSALR